MVENEGKDFRGHFSARENFFLFREGIYQQNINGGPEESPLLVSVGHVVSFGPLTVLQSLT